MTVLEEAEENQSVTDNSADEMVSVGELPDCVTRLVDSERTFYLIGTAHVSEKSVAEVREVIEKVIPDTVCLELCWKRYEALCSEQDQLQEPIPWRSLFFSRKIFFNLAQVILLGFYRNLGRKFSIEPGAEMKSAIVAGNEVDAWVVPVDRDVDETLRRAWRSLSWWDKMTLLLRCGWFFVGGYGISDETLEDMKRPDKLSEIIGAFASRYPRLKRCMIDERDEYIAEQLAGCCGTRIVAVLGAGHIAGVSRVLAELCVKRTSLAVQSVDAEEDDWEDCFFSDNADDGDEFTDRSDQGAEDCRYP